MAGEFRRRLLKPSPWGEGGWPSGQTDEGTGFGLNSLYAGNFAAAAASDFLSDEKVTKESPGDGSGWTLRVHIRIPYPLWPSAIIPTPFGLRPFPPDRGNRPLDKGSRPPGGRLRKNKKGQVWDLSLKTQRRNAVSQNVLLPTFLSRKVGGETQFRIKFLWFLSFLKKGTALFLLNVHHQAHPAGVAAALKLGV